MLIHYLQQVPFEGPASVANWAQRRGHVLRGSQCYRDEPLPDVSGFDLLLVLGGPMGVGDLREYPWLTREKLLIERALASGKPVLGICLGAQLLADTLGAPVSRNPCPEIGWFPVWRTADAEGLLPADFPQRFPAFHWHGDTFGLPDGAVRLFSSEACREQGFLYGERALGLQFHLETTPDSARALIQNCRQELVPGEWVQEERSLLSRPDDFRQANRGMEGLLDWFVGRS